MSSTRPLLVVVDNTTGDINATCQRFRRCSDERQFVYGRPGGQEYDSGRAVSVQRRSAAACGRTWSESGAFLLHSVLLCTCSAGLL
jgi:hypothetical protein